MAIIPEAVDGFDHLTVAQSIRKWDNATGTLVAGVYGQGSALEGPVAKTKTLSANYSTGFWSFHYYTAALAAHTIFGVLDALAPQCDIRIDNSGGLQFTRNGTLLGTVSTLKLVANTWYHFVIKITVNNTTGVVEARINGVTYLTLTGQDTQSNTNAFFNQHRIDTSAGRAQRFDNFMFWDTSGGSGNDLTGFPTGEPVVDTKFITGAGANADWTPSASTNSTNVDDPTPDDDTTYNASLTPGQIDTFAVGALNATSGTVINVLIDSIDCLDDATPHFTSHRYKSGASVTDSTAFASSAGYMNHQTACPLDPATGAAWTVGGRNAMQAGYKLQS